MIQDPNSQFQSYAQQSQNSWKTPMPRKTQPPQPQNPS